MEKCKHWKLQLSRPKKTTTFVNEEKEIEKKATIAVSDIKGKTNLKKFVGAKAGDGIENQNLFNDDQKLMAALGMSKEEVEGLEIPLTFTIEEVTEIELAELDQELFDKLFPDGSVTSVTVKRSDQGRC